MNKTNISRILFSLALIAALALAVVPMAPAHALSNSTANIAITSVNNANTMIPTPNNGVVCKSVTFWRNGHRIVLRVCHKVEKPSS